MDRPVAGDATRRARGATLATLARAARWKISAFRRFGEGSKLHKQERRPDW
jgi:hypothetical protein